MTKPFSVSINEGIAELIFNRPPVNAFNAQGWLDIAAEIDALGVNPDVRVIIIAAVAYSALDFRRRRSGPATTSPAGGDAAPGPGDGGDTPTTSPAHSGA